VIGVLGSLTADQLKFGRESERFVLSAGVERVGAPGAVASIRSSRTRL
jgi:hypothetical protein